MSVVGVKIAELPQLLTPQSEDKIPVQHGQSTYKINYEDLIGPQGPKGDSGDVTPEAQQALAAAQAAAQAAAGSAQSAGDSAADAEDAADRAEQAASTLDNASAYGEVGPVPTAAMSDALPLDAAKLVVDIEPVQAGSGDPSPTNVRPISGWTGANVVVSPTINAQDGTTYPISWQSVAGTVYGGTLNVTTGLLTVTMAEVDLGTLYWVYDGNEIFRNNLPSAKFKGLGICSKYQVIQVASWSQVGDKQMSVTNSQDDPILRIHDSSMGTDAASFKAAMSGVQFVYELATPQTYQLTPTQISLLAGVNNVWADCGDTTVGYWRDDSLSINKAITERAYDRQQGEALADDVGALSAAMTYVVSGNKSIEMVAIPVGAYVRLVGSTIAGRSDGIYTVAKAIPVNTVIDGTYFNESAPIPGGGLNAINNKSAATITILPGTTHAGGDGLATWDTTGINLQGKTLISVQVKFSGDNNWYLISQGSVGSVAVDINNNMPILYTNKSSVYGKPCRALYI